jgi:nucleotide-binding universal stress UspA family protein
MLKHIVVPLDGSVLSHGALEHALNLLGGDGHITLVSVLPSPEYPISDFYPPAGGSQSNEIEARFRELFTQTQSYLMRVADEILAEHPYRVTIEVEIGDPAAMIADLAERYSADAIVMSTHGRSGLSRWLFGSVTQKVLAVAVCPVYVVPAKAGEDATAVKEAEELRALPSSDRFRTSAGVFN